MNFTRLENIKKLTCRTRNTIGQSEATVNVDILCKREKLVKIYSFILFSK
jgi:hypothetical protein